MKNLNFEKVFSDAKNFTLTENDSYIKIYPELITYFEKLEKISEHSLIIGSHFVYGWMPTIIHLNLEEKEKAIFLLNAVKNERILDFSELEILKKTINNSLVGLSKLLHFINPKNYAIWDSRIYRYITEKKSQYGIGNVENYIKYLNGIETISKNEKYEQLHSIISEKFEYNIFPTRVIEIVMFETDRNNNNRKKQ